MMHSSGDCERSDSLRDCVERLLGSLLPNLDVAESRRLLDLAAAHGSRAQDDLTVNLRDVAMSKTLCDLYFLRTVGPKALRERVASAKASSGEEAPVG